MLLRMLLSVVFVRVGVVVLHDILVFMPGYNVVVIVVGGVVVVVVVGGGVGMNVVMVSGIDATVIFIFVTMIVGVDIRCGVCWCALCC